MDSSSASQQAEVPSVRELITPERVIPRLRGASKEDVMRELVGILADHGQVTDSDAAFDSVMEREARRSTAMGQGVAVPLGKTDAVMNLVAAVGISREGIDFDALDGKPCHIIVLTLSPRSQPMVHLHVVAEYLIALQGERVRKDLLRADSEALIAKILSASLS